MCQTSIFPGWFPSGVHVLLATSCPSHMFMVSSFHQYSGQVSYFGGCPTAPDLLELHYDRVAERQHSPGSRLWMWTKGWNRSLLPCAFQRALNFDNHPQTRVPVVESLSSVEEFQQKKSKNRCIAEENSCIFLASHYPGAARLSARRDPLFHRGKWEGSEGAPGCPIYTGCCQGGPCLSHLPQDTEVIRTTETQGEVGAQHPRLGTHRRHADPIIYFAESTRKPAHKPLEMPHFRPPIWPMVLPSGPCALPYTLHSQLPVCVPTGRGCELLQVASAHTRKAGWTLQDWEKAHRVELSTPP